MAVNRQPARGMGVATMAVFTTLLALMLCWAASPPAHNRESQLIQRNEIEAMLRLEEYVVYTRSLSPKAAAAHAKRASHSGVSPSNPRPLFDLVTGHTASNDKAVSTAALLAPPTKVPAVVHGDTSEPVFERLQGACNEKQPAQHDQYVCHNQQQ
jgi:hypothetical protein